MSYKKQQQKRTRNCFTDKNLKKDQGNWGGLEANSWLRVVKARFNLKSIT